MPQPVPDPISVELGRLSALVSALSASIRDKELPYMHLNPPEFWTNFASNCTTVATDAQRRVNERVGSSIMYSITEVTALEGLRRLNAALNSFQVMHWKLRSGHFSEDQADAELNQATDAVLAAMDTVMPAFKRLDEATWELQATVNTAGKDIGTPQVKPGPGK